MDDVEREGERRYQVEHRNGHETRALGQLTTAIPHVSVLDPWVSHLVRGGAAGEVRLIDEATGAVVVRQTLDRRRRWRIRARPRYPSQTLHIINARRLAPAPDPAQGHSPTEY
jgi:hypothetical protein